jgi:hypothetical protein
LEGDSINNFNKKKKMKIDETEKEIKKTLISIRLFDGTQIKANYPVEAKLTGLAKVKNKK